MDLLIEETAREIILGCNAAGCYDFTTTVSIETQFVKFSFPLYVPKLAKGEQNDATTI
jgi:hypothetical protein